MKIFKIFSRFYFLLWSLLGCHDLSGADITWTSPVTISPMGQDSSDPQITIDSQGNVVAAWVTDGIIHSAVKMAGGNWQDTMPLSGANASNPHLVCDPFGNVTAVWIQSGVIQAATLPIGGSWTSATNLSLSGATSPSIAVSPAGDVVAVWVRNGNIESATQLFNQSWPGSPNVITSTQAAYPNVSIGAGPSYQVAVIWHGVGGNNKTAIYSSNKQINGSWSPAVQVTNTSLNESFPSVAVDSQGNLLAVWFESEVNSANNTLVTVNSSSCTVNGVWTTPVSISATGSRNPADLQLSVVFDPQDNAIAVWTISLDGSTFNVQSSLHPLNESWMTPITVVQNDLYSYSYGLGMNALGNAYIATMVYRQATIESIFVRGSMVGGLVPLVWSQPYVVSNTAQNGFPQIAASQLSPSMNGIAVAWVAYNGVNNVINVALGTNPLLPPPTNVAVSQQVRNMNVFYEYYNTLTWQDSPANNIAYYVVYRNGVSIGMIKPGVKQCVDENRDPANQDIYSIAAIDSEGFQSVPVIVQNENYRKSQ